MKIHINLHKINRGSTSLSGVRNHKKVSNLDDIETFSVVNNRLSYQNLSLFVEKFKL